uniref:C2 domain-containing protein n=1 Tax=Meloidogyne javanica TaxID=6303 RepID=A0A915MTK3_MELJA
MTHEATLVLNFAGVLAITARNENSENFVEIGQSETISSLNPKFERNVVFVFRLDLEQQIRLIFVWFSWKVLNFGYYYAMVRAPLYSVDHKTEVIQRKIGQSNFNLFSILHGVSESLQIPLLLDQEIKSSQPSFIQCTVSQPGNCGVNSGTVFQFIGHNMDNSGLIPSPYFLLELVPTNNVEESSPLPILLYRSEFCNKNANPRWKEFLLPSQFFPSSADWSLRISCYNYAYNQIEGDQLIGQAFTTFYQLIGMNSVKFLLRTGHKNKDQNPSIELVRVSNEPVPSLINLIKSGHQFYSTIAIDFTSNNGGPNSPDSLHFIHPHISNAYTHVLEGVSTTFSRIDKLRRIALLGFGAKLPPSFQFSNLFALNGSLDSPWLRSTPDILNCYKNFSLSLLPFAPTQYSQPKALLTAHMRSSTLFLLAVVLLAVIVQLHAGPQAGQKPAATKKKAIEGKPTGNKVASKQNKGKPKGQASNKIVHAAKEGAQHAKDAVSKLAHGNKPNGEVIGDDKLKTEIKTVLDGMIKHPEKIKQGNKAKLVKAVTFEKSHKAAAALPKTNAKHPKKPAAAHPTVPKNAQAKLGHLNVHKANGKNRAASLPKLNSGLLKDQKVQEAHGKNRAASVPNLNSGLLKNLANVHPTVHKNPQAKSGLLNSSLAQHVSGPKSVKTSPEYSPINSENLRGKVEYKLPNSLNSSVSSPLASNISGGKTEMDSDEDWDAEDVDDFNEFSNKTIGNNGKAKLDEDNEDASDENKSDELDDEDFKENELNSNLMKKAEDKDSLSKGNEDLDEELKKKAFNEKVREATELALKVGDEIKEMNVPKVNSAPQVKNSLFDQIGNPAPVGLVGA